MNDYELETFELIVEVYDENTVMSNKLIGKQSVGLSTLYRSLNHEFHRIWLTLYNHDENDNVKGYL